MAAESARGPEPFAPFAGRFPTASGKLEFVSARMAQAGLDPIAGYTPAYEASQRDSTLARDYRWHSSRRRIITF